ncbi:MAG: DUF6106 family protein [Oscillospiraceae bacterium]|jgi:hypothetical protein|nr:DUF6106 family protein [Oscillospiraceae bacterium]
MADVFVEHLIQQRPTGKILMKKAMLVVAAMVAAMLPSIISMVCLMFGANVNLLSLTPLTLVGSGWGLIILFRRLNLEYEYIVTNGEMDVDKIMGRNLRKRLLTVDCRTFDILAPYKEEYRNEYSSQTIANRIDVSSHPEAPGRWFAIFNAKDGLRTLLVFEPSERMLDAFKIFIRGKIKQ